VNILDRLVYVRKWCDVIICALSELSGCMKMFNCPLSFVILFVLIYRKNNFFSL